jgi:hypothetical protein
MADKNQAPNGQPTETGRDDEPRAAQRITVDTSQVTAAYANFCRVTGTPEEVILDFGLNDQPFGEGDRAVPVTQRIVLNFYTAKRMLGALSMTVQRHEQAFGPLETDIRRRVVAQAETAQRRRAKSE